jgi:polyhydroxyalkanoate synthase subunit PhaC
VSEAPEDRTLVEQSRAAAENVAEIVQLSARLWQKFLEAQGGGGRRPDPLNTWPTFAKLARTMGDHPQQMTALALEYWSAQNALWQRALLKWLGAGDRAEEVEVPHMRKPDKRFAHEAWTENAVFDYLKQQYLLTAGWLQDAVGSVGEMEPADRKKAAFYTRAYVEAMNPANFFWLNPEVLETTVNERGANLVRGLTMMLEDLERGRGTLLPRQTDVDAFEVGRNTAISEGAVIWQNELLQLIQYAPLTEEVHARPLLFLPPWINKYYILDLNPKKSMVKWLVERGCTVFMISWVNPDARHADQTWESYMFDGAVAAIDKVLEETGETSLNLISYCVGGTLAGTLMAYFGRTDDRRVESCTFFTAQFDFQDAGELQVFIDDRTLEVLGEEMEQGFMPANRMAHAFNMLRANDLIWGYIVNNYMLGRHPFPFDLLFWNSDATAMPAGVHRYYLEQFYVKNVFAHGKLSVRSEPVSLGDIRVPAYHLAAREDHIAPAASVYRGVREMTRSDVRFVLAGSGHIAGVINPPAANKYNHWTNADLSEPTVEEWLEGATETPGSWWPDWHAWLGERAGGMVPPRTPGARLGVIEPAPGSYVKARFDQPLPPSRGPVEP